MKPEAQLLRAVLDLLAAKRIFALRMNTGAVRLGNRFVRFGVPGTADVLAFPARRVLWIECKAAAGKQSALQKSFQMQVEGEGHRYIVVRDVNDLIKEL